MDETEFVEELSDLCEAYSENGLDRKTIAANLRHEAGVQLEAKRVEDRGTNGEE